MSHVTQSPQYSPLMRVLGFLSGSVVQVSQHIRKSLIRTVRTVAPVWRHGQHKRSSVSSAFQPLVRQDYHYLSFTPRLPRCRNTESYITGRMMCYTKVSVCFPREIITHYHPSTPFPPHHHGLHRTIFGPSSSSFPYLRLQSLGQVCWKCHRHLVLPCFMVKDQAPSVQPVSGTPATI